MSIHYRFDPNTADATRDEMARVTNKLKAELANLDQQTQSRLAEWEGGAKDAYRSAKQQWDQAAERMTQNLGRAEVALNQITQGYLKVEHTGTNAWGGFTVR